MQNESGPAPYPRCRSPPRPASEVLGLGVSDWRVTVHGAGGGGVGGGGAFNRGKENEGRAPSRCRHAAGPQ